MPARLAVLSPFSHHTTGSEAIFSTVWEVVWAPELLFRPVGLLVEGQNSRIGPSTPLCTCEEDVRMASVLFLFILIITVPWFSFRTRMYTRWHKGGGCTVVSDTKVFFIDVKYRMFKFLKLLQWLLWNLECISEYFP